GKLKYRVVGLLWGGTETVRALGIRFNPEEEYVRVESLPVPQTAPWTLWSTAWTPATRGTYTIRLKVMEPPSQTRRLDSGYYARGVEMEEVGPAGSSNRAGAICPSRNRSRKGVQVCIPAEFDGLPCCVWRVLWARRRRRASMRAIALVRCRGKYWTAQ